MSFVSLDDFQTRYENTIPAADEVRVGALLDDACALAADITGTTYAGVLVDLVLVFPPVPGAITATVCTAVRRAYENPMGLSGETIGDYGWRASSGSDSGVYFTPNEDSIMRRAAGKSSVGTLELEGMLPDTIGAGIGNGAYVTVDGVTYWQGYPNTWQSW